MKRPKIQLETTLQTKVLRFLVVSFLLASVLVLIFYYNQLPEKVPIHFNWPSKEGGLGNKDILWAAPIILGLISFILLRLANFPWILNYPTKITEENAKAQYTVAAFMLRLLSLLIAFTCLTLILGSLSSIKEFPSRGIEMIYSILPYLFFGLPLYFVFKLAFMRQK